MPDFFPLVEGAVREFELKDSQGSSRITNKVLEVSTQGAVTTAKGRRTVARTGKPATTSEFTVTKDAQGVREGGYIEFQNPVNAGTEWISPPRRFWIASLDAAVETPAGKFKNCLRVAYLIAEGDGGSGERFYAPGVGLVKVVDNDEGEPFTYQLVKRN